MAKGSTLGLTTLCLVLVLSSVTVRSHSVKEIILYGELISGGPRANTILVASPNPTPATNDAKFGEVYVFDHPLRESIDGDSPVVGTSQGILVSSSMDGTRAYISGSVIIEGGKYKVGSLELQGSLKVEGPRFTGELGVPSGTVSYRFMGGYVDAQTVRYDPATQTSIIRLKFSIKEFDDRSRNKNKL